MTTPSPASDPFLGAELTQVRLADGIVAHLTQAILDARIKPGEFLPSESALAARYGVSKPVVREAIRQLAGQGVLQVGQGRATQVRALNADPLGRFWLFAAGAGPEGLAEAVELRRMLEPPAARVAALRRTAPQLDSMQGTLAAMQEALGDVPRWIEADLAFHTQVARMAGNRLLLLQMQGLAPVIRNVMDRFNARAARSRTEWQATWDRHARVADAIAAGHAEAAEQAMFAHFTAADRAIAELFPGGPPIAAHDRRTPAPVEGGS